MFTSCRMASHLSVLQHVQQVPADLGPHFAEIGRRALSKCDLFKSSEVSFHDRAPLAACNFLHGAIVRLTTSPCLAAWIRRELQCGQ